MNIFEHNPSAMRIIREAIRRSNKPLNKYSESIHQSTEALSGESNDRMAYDAGMEMERHE